MAETTKIRKRSEIPVEDTWAIEDLYASDEAWEQELATLSEDEKVLTSFAGKLGEKAENLYAYMEKNEAVNAKAELLGNYCMRRADVDTRDATYQAMVGKFMSVVVGLSAATSFETPEIGKYDIKVTYSYGEDEGAVSYPSSTFFNLSYSPEYDSFQIFDTSALHEAIRQRGVVSENGDIKLENDENMIDTYVVDFTMPFLIAAVALYVIDVIIRKLKWSDIRNLFKKKA